jgi:hypothetical protein
LAFAIETDPEHTHDLSKPHPSSKLLLWVAIPLAEHHQPSCLSSGVMKYRLHNDHRSDRSLLGLYPNLVRLGHLLSQVDA